MPEVVYSDRTRLQQVLNNLVGNAVKFTSAGSIVLKVWAQASHLLNSPRHYISVSDSGIGIPENKMEEVFLAFTQADSSTTRKYGGTALGLGISRCIVELLGSEIKV